MLFNLKKIKDYKAFTLIEILTAVTIFSMLVSVFAGYLVSSIKSQQKALSSQQLVDSVSYNLEYMSRAIRMAKKELSDPPVCLSSTGLNYEETRSGKGLKFINYDGVCQEFFWDDSEKRLYESKDGGTALPLTPATLRITSFKLEDPNTWGQAQTPQKQPRVTFSLKMEKSGEVLMNIQTTISQRNLNRIY